MHIQRRESRGDVSLEGLSGLPAGGDSLVPAARAAEGDAMGEWIPVDERLPEIGVSVLAVDFGKVCEMAWNGRYWVVPASKWDWVGDGVTHWMPLPKPPEVKL